MILTKWGLFITQIILSILLIKEIIYFDNSLISKINIIILIIFLFNCYIQLLIEVKK